MHFKRALTSRFQLSLYYALALCFPPVLSCIPQLHYSATPHSKRVITSALLPYPLLLSVLLAQAGGGSGLGMMITKGIVDLHGGEIRYDTR
jgi:tetrahydromethanopterin S-methyltransferase subunit E